MTSTSFKFVLTAALLTLTVPANGYVIDCTNGACDGQTVECVANEACQVDCTENNDKRDNRCRDTIINGNGATAINVLCVTNANVNALCQRLTVLCDTAETCHLECRCDGDCDGDDLCRSALLDCSGDCSLHCSNDDQTSCTDLDVDITDASSFDCNGLDCSASNAPPDFTANPSESPTIQPTIIPTNNPTTMPTHNPTNKPTKHPSTNPSLSPTNNPTVFPTHSPSNIPTISTLSPTENPTHLTSNPTSSPSIITNQPTISPTNMPTKYPIIDGKEVLTAILSTTNINFESDQLQASGLLSNISNIIIIILVVLILFLLCVIALCIVKKRKSVQYDSQGTVIVEMNSDGMQSEGNYQTEQDTNHSNIYETQSANDEGSDNDTSDVLNEDMYSDKEMNGHETMGFQQVIRINSHHSNKEFLEPQQEGDGNNNNNTYNNELIEIGNTPQNDDADSTQSESAMDNTMLNEYGATTIGFTPNDESDHSNSDS